MPLSARFNPARLSQVSQVLAALALLIALVQAVQMLGDRFAHRHDRRGR